MRAKDDAAAAAILAVSAGIRARLHLVPRGGVYRGMVTVLMMPVRSILPPVVHDQP